MRAVGGDGRTVRGLEARQQARSSDSGLAADGGTGRSVRPVTRLGRMRVAGGGRACVDGVSPSEHDGWLVMP